MVLLTYYIAFPFNIGFICILVGLITQINYFKNEKYKILYYYISSILIFSGLVLSLQASLLPFLYRAFSSHHVFMNINQLICSILNLLNLPSLNFFNPNCNYDQIITATESKSIFHVITYEKLNIQLFLLIILTSSIYYILLYNKIQKYIVISKYLVIISIYFIFRYIIFHIYSSYTNDITIYYNPEIIFLSFLPIIYCLKKGLGNNNKLLYNASKTVILKIESGFAISYIAGFIFVVMNFLLFYDISFSSTKKGDIVIDESHSKWEQTSNNYDTTWYNLESGYNYNSLKNYIANYYNVRINEVDINDSLLINCDILIIKTPTKSFNDIEINTIRDYVKNGGSLFLIGDHTNVFGMGSYLNNISEVFGLKYNYDALYEMQTGNLVQYKPENIFRNELNKNINTLLFLTGCSIDAPFLADYFILSSKSFSSEADYSQKNFFPNSPLDKTNTKYGTFVSCCGVKYFKGRVLLFTDSTIWSNFCIFFNGKIDLLMNSLEWLNQKNIILNMKLYVLLGLLILCSLISIKLYKINSKSTFLLKLFIGSLFGFLFMIVFNYYYFSIKNYSLPKSISDNVYFDFSHAPYLPLPIEKDSYYKFTNNESRSMCFQTAFVWTQRINKFPVSVLKFDNEYLRSSKLNTLCIINPRKPFTDNDKEYIQSFIIQGGKLILFDNGDSFQQSKSNDILKRFNVYLEPYSEEKTRTYIRDTLKIHNHSIRIDSSISITGLDTVWYKTLRSNNILGLKRIGKGCIIICSYSNLFSDLYMGSISSVPDDLQLDLYRKWFKILLLN